MVDFVAELAQALSAPEVKVILQCLVREAVRSELQDTQPPQRFLDVAAAAALLQMSEAAVRKAAQRGTIPCVRLGRRLRFDPRALTLEQPDSGSRSSRTYRLPNRNP